MRTDNDNVLTAVFLISAATILGILLFTQGACTNMPPSCLTMCERVEAWSKACNKPMVFGSAAACAKTYGTNMFDTSGLNDSHERECWNKLLEYKDEVDCNKPPELPR